MKKTLRLSFPDWQGGVYPPYYQGGRLLDMLAPKTENMICAEVPVPVNFGDIVPLIDGVKWKNELLKQQADARRICEKVDPDKIIVLGGTCTVEQAPFDYLHGKYSDNTAVIWIDAHPDISWPEVFCDEHAMVLGNLLGQGALDFAAQVQNKFDKKDVIYVGLVEDQLETWERRFQSENHIEYLTPERLSDGSAPLINWLKAGGYKHAMIHWDLDVLSPDDFRSLLCSEPHIPPVSYAVGKMRLEQIIDIIKDVSAACDIVALGITEFMPWDIMRLQKGLNELDIFK